VPYAMPARWVSCRPDALTGRVVLGPSGPIAAKLLTAMEESKKERSAQHKAAADAVFRHRP
jgi:hypothetical protein